MGLVVRVFFFKSLAVKKILGIQVGRFLLGFSYRRLDG